MPKSPRTKTPSFKPSRGFSPAEATRAEGRLRKLIDDPLKIAGDPEFEDFVAKQFDTAFGTGPVARDATGRTVPPRLRSDKLEPFRPKVTPDDLKLAGTVRSAEQNDERIDERVLFGPEPKGARRHAPNRPADVLKLQKALSNTGDFVFDTETEVSGRTSKRLDDAVRRFQKRAGLKVDGIVNPDGPTNTRLATALFEPRDAGAQGGPGKTKSAAARPGSNPGPSAKDDPPNDPAGSGARPNEAPRAAATDRTPDQEEPEEGEDSIASSEGDQEQTGNDSPGDTAIIIPRERRADLEVEARARTSALVAGRFGTQGDEAAEAFAALRAAQQARDTDGVAAAAGRIAGLIADPTRDPAGFMTGSDAARTDAAVAIVAAAHEGGDVHARVLDLAAEGLGVTGYTEAREDLEHTERVRLAHARLRPDRAGVVGNAEMGAPGRLPLERAAAVRGLARELRDVDDMSEAEFADFLARGASHIRPEEFEQFEVVARAVRSRDLFWVRGQRIVTRDYAPRTARDEIFDTILDFVPLVGEAREAIALSEALTTFFDAEEAGDEEFADEAAGTILAILGTAAMGPLLRRVPVLGQVVGDVAGRAGPEARQILRRFLRRPPRRALRPNQENFGRVITAIYLRRRTWFGRMADNVLAIDSRIIGTPGSVIRAVPGRLARNMLKELGVFVRGRWTGYQAHHIIPTQWQDHPALVRAGYEMDHAANGMFLRANARSGRRFRMSTHWSQHPGYSDAIWEQLEDLNLNDPPELLARQIRAIREHARRGLLNEMPLNGDDNKVTRDLWRTYMSQVKLPGR